MTTNSTSGGSSSKGIMWVAVVAGLVLVAIAVVYWTHTAGSLPAYFPGHEVGATNVHFKHGLGAFILGIGAFIFAWFKSAPKAY